MESGVSLIVATRDDLNAPAIARAGGCRVGNDGRVAVFLAPEQSQRCLDNAAANGRVALLCVVPHGYECYQIKGEAARVAPLERGDPARIGRITCTACHDVHGAAVPTIRSTHEALGLAQFAGVGSDIYVSLGINLLPGDFLSAPMNCAIDCHGPAGWQRPF